MDGQLGFKPACPPMARSATSRPASPFLAFSFFETLRPVVVLSSSNKAEAEAHPEICALHGVPILQRKGGGGTVALGPGCVVLTLAFYARDVFGNSGYFRAINDLWAKALAEIGVANVQTRGISDLAVGNQKIAGTSIFRRKHLLVYQGSLLVNPHFEFMSELLAHPTREPDYRAGRSHESFLTSTVRQGCLLSAAEVAKHCQTYFQIHAREHLKSCFADNEVLSQIPNVFPTSSSGDASSF